MGAAPTVSIVIPAKDEADYLPECLDSVGALEGTQPAETFVVDGDSDDRTAEIARSRDDVRLIEGPGESIGGGRALGAEHADGDWLAFVDADTVLEPSYLTEMLSFVRENDLDAATSRCHMDGVRPKLMQATINRVFPHLRRPILPGFNFFVDADVYDAAGGFPEVPNEDTAFSRHLGREFDTAYHPDVLVETSGRRIHRYGLTGTLLHYVYLDVGRLRAEYR
ncbi:glycosyltransferase [Salinarchaeum laminariae]|uniref:glycosyltransferase n=1 Tax=Salinarchaeum laminariae TaxID=869888 RepID=UPI0020BF6EE6|nr:glycosyltransferase [Salinarchaeum laminariae]